MAQSVTVAINLGPAKAGLSDLRAQLIDTTGAAVGTAVSTGFTDLGTGAYQWFYASVPGTFQRGTVKFYSNAASTVTLATGSIGPGDLLAVNGSGGADFGSILGTGFTETTAGNIAAAFKHFLDVASPAFTAASVNQTGDSFARIGVNGAGLTAVPTSGDFTTAMKTSLSAATPVVTLNASQGNITFSGLNVTNAFAVHGGVNISNSAGVALTITGAGGNTAVNIQATGGGDTIDVGNDGNGADTIAVANAGGNGSFCLNIVNAGGAALELSNEGGGTAFQVDGTFAIGNISISGTSALATESNATSNKNTIVNAVGSATTAANSAATAAGGAATSAADAATAAAAVKVTTDLLATTWTVSNGVAAFTGPALANGSGLTTDQSNKLNVIYANTGSIIAGKVTVRSPVVSVGNLTIIQGNDYNTDTNQPLLWTDTGGNWPDLTGATIAFALLPNIEVRCGAGTPVTGSVIVPSGSGKQVQVQLTASYTAALAPGAAVYNFAVIATLSSGSVCTLVAGTVDVVGSP